jgi:hypothetical protein
VKRHLFGSGSSGLGNSKIEMGAESELTFEEWIGTVPEKMKSDPLWKSIYYRKGMYLYDLVWHDCELLRRDFRGRVIANQLIRSTGSICANME